MAARARDGRYDPAVATSQHPGTITAVVRRIRRLLDDAGASLVGRRVLVLCSGGADSVALTALLAELPTGAAPRSIDVLWLDHAIRSEVADDRAAAQAAAARAGAAFHERRSEQDLRSGEAGSQAAARDWRYATALRVARELGCDTVCTGHTASDQLENVLLSLVGVTGTAGEPSGMRPVRPLAPDVQLVRPLLGLTRGSIEVACSELQLEWTEDPSNADPDAYTRNDVRNRVVPALLDVHPGAGLALARAAARRSSSSDAIGSLATALLDAWAVSELLDTRDLAQLDPAARGTVVATWLRRSIGGRHLTSRHVAAVERLAAPTTRGGAAADLPCGACVRRDGYHLRIDLAPRHGGSRP